jgi:hypothetical protein
VTEKWDLQPIYNADERAKITAAAKHIRAAREGLLAAWKLIEPLGRHDKEYGGSGIMIWKNVLWLVGEDGARAEGEDGMLAIAEQLERAGK